MRGVARSESSPKPEPELISLEGQVWRGAYRILRRVEDGTLRVTYEAIHLGRGTLVQIRFLGRDLSRGQGAVHRRELAALRCLAHPHIASVIDFDTDDSTRHFAVTELLSGETLQARLERERRIELRETSDIVLAVGGALEAARQALVLHGDLDADHVVLEGNAGHKIPKIVGLGFVRQESGEHRVMTSEILPLRDVNIDRADQRALATLAFRMLTGRLPFASALTERPVAEVAPAAGAFGQAILRALEPSPRGGYDSFSEFMRALSLGALAISSERSESGAFLKSTTITGRAKVRQQPATPDDIARAVQLCRRAVEIGDIYEASFRAERAVQMAADAKSPIAMEIVERAFALLERVFYARLGGGARRLLPRRASSTWTELRISQNDGVLLSHLAGGQTLDDALRLSDRARLETLKDLAALARRGLISIE